MEFTSETIISFVTLLLGGGGIGAILTWRYQRKKAKAEAEQAEAEAKQKEAEAEKAKFEAMQANAQLIKDIQDSYQRLTADLKANLDTQQEYNEEQKQYIRELKEDRQHLREDRDDLRRRQDELEGQVRGLQRDVARNGRQIDCMRPFLCGREKCPHRVVVAVSADGVAEPTETAKTAKTKKKTTKKTETDGNKNK